MPLYTTAYETTMGKFTDLSKIVKVIKESMIMDGLYRYNKTPFNSDILNNFKDYNLVLITGVFSSETMIPVFHYPVIIEHDKRKIVCVDVRPFVSYHNEELRIRNDIDYGSQIDKLIFTTLWLNGYVKDMRVSLNFAGIVFTHWLSETISKRFALDPKDQVILNVITFVYYQTLFMENKEFSNVDKDILSIHTIKNLTAPGELITDVISHIDRIESIDDYTRLVRTILNNIRLKEFSTPMLLNLISNSWYGTYAKENISVALEYPPIWLSIVYNALNERTFKNSIISRIAERYGKMGKADNFISNFKNIRKLCLDNNKEDAVAVESFYKQQVEQIINSMQQTD